jgi:L-cysteate sulfo-lyase
MSIVDLPRVDLGLFPTPLQELKNLSKALGGPRIIAKREDLNGLASGGNKVRNLELVLAGIKNRGADTIIATSSAQSNYLVQLAAAARKLDMNTGFIVYAGQHPEAQGNLLLQSILKSRVKILQGDRSSGEFLSKCDEEMDKMAKEYIKEGNKPIIVKYGDDLHLDNLAMAGWSNGADELSHQLQAAAINATYLVVSVGTCVTISGIISGLKLLQSPLKVIGISVSKGKPELIERIIEKTKTLTEFMKWNLCITPEDMEIYDDYIGEKYGVPTRECLEAIKLVARTEGFFLDPVYTGKGMAGLIDLIKKGRFKPEDTVVFLETGGFPAVFAYHREILASCETD